MPKGILRPISPRKTLVGSLMITKITVKLSDSRRHYWEA
jgi:hypothetical protein